MELGRRRARGYSNVNKSIYNGMCLALCALAAVGCADAEQHPAVTTSVPGSAGVSGGPLTNTLTVYAIDADSGEPIAGAAVFLGSGQGAKSVGHTDQVGKLALAGLGGTPQMVSISSAGYAAATWGLVKSAVATIPLESTGSPASDVTVTISIPAWDDLPPVAAGAYRVARFSFSRPKGLDALEVPLTSPLPECKQTSTTTGSCSVTFQVPPDTTSVLAVIAEGTDSGTPDDPSDDNVAMTALGIQTGLSLRAVLSQGLTLSLLDSTSVAFAQMSTSVPTESVFEDVIGVPGISLDGQILLYPGLGPRATSFLVPTANGPFVNAKLWAVATADNGTSTAWSRVYERGIDPVKSASQTVKLTTSTFIESPSITKTGPYQCALTGDGNVQRLEFATPSGEQLNALLFPAQTEFEIPAGVLSEEPNAAAVESFDLEVDPSSFNLAELTQSTRIAYTRADAL